MLDLAALFKARRWYLVRLMLLCSPHFLGFQALADCQSALQPYSPGERGKLTKLFEDWGAYRIEDKNVCWISSMPTKTRLLNNKNPEELCRSEPLFHVLLSPDGEPVFKAGVIVSTTSAANLQTEVGSFNLPIVDGEYAFPLREYDQEIIQSIAVSKTFEITFTTADGTQAIDYFSTRGFTLALREAEAQCGIANFLS